MATAITILLNKLHYSSLSPYRLEREFTEEESCETKYFCAVLRSADTPPWAVSELPWTGETGIHCYIARSRSTCKEQSSNTPSSGMLESRMHAIRQLCPLTKCWQLKNFVMYWVNYLLSRTCLPGNRTWPLMPTTPTNIKHTGRAEDHSSCLFPI